MYHAMNQPRSVRRVLLPALLGCLAVFGPGCGSDDETGALAAALTTGSSDAAVFDAATSNVTLIDFNGSTAMAVDGTSFSPAVAFTSPESATPGLVFWNSDAITDTGSTTAPNSVGPVGATLAAPAGALAFNYSSGTLGEVVLYDGGGAAFATLTPAAQGGFFGVVSTTPIKAVTIYGILFDADGNRDRLFIDNFRIADILSAELACPCAGPVTGGAWKNHGQYVSCVAHTVNALRDAGLISEGGGGAIVSAAARSACGKK